MRLIFLFIAGNIYLANRFLWEIWYPGVLPIPYLNDVLCIPIVLTIALFFQQHIIYKNIGYRLTKFQVVFPVGYFALVFEGMLPLFSSRYTADIWDVVAFAAGGIIYYLSINPKAISASGDTKAIS